MDIMVGSRNRSSTASSGYLPKHIFDSQHGEAPVGIRIVPAKMTKAKGRRGRSGGMLQFFLASGGRRRRGGGRVKPGAAAVSGGGSANWGLLPPCRELGEDDLGNINWRVGLLPQRRGEEGRRGSQGRYVICGGRPLGRARSGFPLEGHLSGCYPIVDPA